MGIVSVELAAPGAVRAYLINKHDTWNDLCHTLVDVALDDLVDLSS